MATERNDQFKTSYTKRKDKETNRRDINKGYTILYLGVFVFIIIGEIILYNLEQNFSLIELARDVIGNLMGVFAAFLVFDIAHEKLSKDSYASEVSEQILDTLMYHPEVLEIYDNDQKKVFLNALVTSMIEDPDAVQMINHHLNYYLLTSKDFQERVDIADNDCRIKTAFSYRFLLDTERTSAFQGLASVKEGRDPYFYVQEELNYKVKYLSPKGNYTDHQEVKIGFVFDNAALDKFLRGNKGGEKNDLLKNCLFRECLDIEEVDKNMFYDLKNDTDALKTLVKKMFRPNLKIDRCRGEIVEVKVIQESGIFVTFKVSHDIDLMEHTIDIVFHIPKRWNTEIEAVLVEPTKEPRISLSYNEDAMDVEMYTFLNNGEASAYENTTENENGIYRIDLTGEWVFPISGAVFSVKRKKKDDF